MEAPKCKLCGERHYGLCARAADGDHPAVDLPSRTPVKAVKTKFDRTAYQRELMRKRRDREKAEALRMRKRRAKEREK